MHASRDEREARAEFADRYGITRTKLLEAIERRVIGDAWGANGFTTVAQANLLGERLALSRHRRLLDLGSGRGWPGLYLALRTECEVVLADLPIEGLQSAARRAARERLNALGCVVSSAARLPFAEQSFDAIVHTDVLC